MIPLYFFASFTYLVTCPLLINWMGALLRTFANLYRMWSVVISPIVSEFFKRVLYFHEGSRWWVVVIHEVAFLKNLDFSLFFSFHKILFLFRTDLRFLALGSVTDWKKIRVLFYKIWIWFHMEIYLLYLSLLVIIFMVFRKQGFKG